jgi:hypothetical protein
VVVLLDNALFEHRHRVRHPGLVAGEFLFESADERRVLFQDPPILRRQRRGHLRQILVKLVEHALHALAILHLAIEFLEHLVGIVDRRHRLVAAGVDHSAPCVGPVGHEDAEFERAEASGRLRPRLQVVADLLVDGDAARPAGRCIAAPPGCYPATVPVARANGG